ncbi:hypothetical protein HN51_051763, partial [Arachis hypogaea]
AKIPSVGLGTFQAENSGALAKILNSTCMNELIRESAEIWWIPNKGYEGKEETELYFLSMEGLENMAFVANAVSLLTYFFGFMYFSLTKSATTLTNFMETAFLLSLVGGFINDTCLSRFKTCVIFASMELLTMLPKRIFGHGGVMISGLDSSVSNDELKHIFGLYGVIKEIYEYLEVNHVKFIEFYDVRAAKASLSALNRICIPGKQIKLEHGHPKIAMYGLYLLLLVVIYFLLVIEYF